MSASRVPLQTALSRIGDPGHSFTPDAGKFFSMLEGFATDTFAEPDADSVLLARRPSDQLHDRFVRQAQQNPGQIALVHRGQSWRYCDLDQRSNQLGRTLRQRGVEAGSLIGICLERSADLVISLLAVLKIGCAYVPLDPEYPSERVAVMLNDSAPRVVVTRSEVWKDMDFAGAVFDLDLEKPALDASRCDPLPAAGDASSLACIFYTSGSTGRPKGVMLRHTATAMIDWAANTFPSGEMDRVAATTSICFDPSVFEIFGPLSLGGTVILKNNLLDRFDPSERPTMLNGGTTAFAKLARTRQIPDSVRVINVGGERVSAKLVRAIYQSSRVDQVWNHYGPTEATICASVALVSRDVDTDPPIGQAIAGALLYVLDEANQPVAPDMTGELFIGGPSLAAGYLNRPDLTETQFLPDPFSADGGRMYRTGDLVRRSSNGDLFFIGRRGRQVKFHGFRIELDDIESALQRVPGVDDAVMLALERNDVVGDLVAVLSSDQAMTLATIRKTLRTMLPAHMLPTKLLVLPSLPLTPSGKVDLHALARLHADDPVADVLPDAVKLPLLEGLVLDVFRDVLKQPSLSQHDDFFDHGGDSLSAADTAAHLEELLGHVVPISLLQHGRTAATLAPLLRRDEATPRHLTILQPDGAGEPLFCLPDIFGRPLSVISLARRFRNERPVYGLSPGPLEDEIIARPSLSRLTAAYITEMKKVKKDGRYLLVGYSAAAIAAIDLACALQAAGDEVVLILIDPRAQRVPFNIRNRLGRHIRMQRAFWTAGPKAAAKAFRRDEVPSWVPDAYLELTDALLQAEADWHPRIFQGQTLLAQCRLSGRLDSLIARVSKDFSSADAKLWKPYLQGPVQIVTADTTHYDLMREPFVGRIASWIRNPLDPSDPVEP